MLSEISNKEKGFKRFVFKKPMAIALSLVSSDYAKILHKDLRIKSPPDEYGKMISIETIDVEKTSRETILESLNEYFPHEISPIILSFWKDTLIYIPFSYALSYPPEEPNVVDPNVRYLKGKFSFSGKLTNAQQEELPKILVCLENTNSVILSSGCGFGKTILTIYLLSLLKLRTVILCHRLNIMDQWRESLKRFSPDTRTWIFSTRERVPKNIDVCIFNITNVKKTERHLFSKFGVLVLDEAHTACSVENSKALLKFTPKYAMALTATPDRIDNLDKILYLHFGSFVIRRPLFRNFNYYIKETGFFPKIETNIMGKLNWNVVLESQAKNEKRNLMILELLLRFRNRRFLVLCKRVEQAKILFNALEDVDSVDIYTGTNRYYNSEKRVLVSTFSKSGVGFDNPTLDALLVAGDIGSEPAVVQFVGRCGGFRGQEIPPMIIDFCDRLAPLKKHLKEREIIYESIGGFRNVL
jgi:SNF2 family DNA or RNA helicase